jgi:hypothetical protein
MLTARITIDRRRWRPGWLRRVELKPLWRLMRDDLLG